jgi:hypothetical protein
LPIAHFRKLEQLVFSRQLYFLRKSDDITSVIIYIYRYVQGGVVGGKA